MVVQHCDHARDQIRRNDVAWPHLVVDSRHDGLLSNELRAAAAGRVIAEIEARHIETRLRNVRQLTAGEYAHRLNALPQRHGLNVLPWAVDPDEFLARRV